MGHGFIDTLQREFPGVDLTSYNDEPGYAVDLKAIAQAITDEHDPNYNAP